MLMVEASRDFMTAFLIMLIMLPISPDPCSPQAGPGSGDACHDTDKVLQQAEEVYRWTNIFCVL